MFLFGHLGIGSKLTTWLSPSSWKLKQPLILLGTILPDLIDKPLYYGLSFFLQKRGEDLGIISGTRTFGHTGLFLILLFLASYRKASPTLFALALGTLTHLFLDCSIDLYEHTRPFTIHVPLFWPLTGFQFPVIPYSDLPQHLSTAVRPSILFTEILGFGLLLHHLFWAIHRRRTKQGAN
jgi:hypothetical protein